MGKWMTLMGKIVAIQFSIANAKYENLETG